MKIFQTKKKLDGTLRIVRAIPTKRPAFAPGQVQSPRVREIRERWHNRGPLESIKGIRFLHGANHHPFAACFHAGAPPQNQARPARPLDGSPAAACLTDRRERRRAVRPERRQVADRGMHGPLEVLPQAWSASYRTCHSRHGCNQRSLRSKASKLQNSKPDNPS